MKVNEKVALEIIKLVITCVVAYKEIALAKIGAQQEIELVKAQNCLPGEIIQ